MIIVGILQKQEQAERCDRLAPDVFNFLEFGICLGIVCPALGRDRARQAGIWILGFN